MDESNLYDAREALRKHGVAGVPEDVTEHVTEEDAQSLAGELGLSMPAVPERDDETGEFRYEYWMEGKDGVAEGIASTAAVAGLLAIAEALPMFSVFASKDTYLVPLDE